MWVKSRTSESDNSWWIHSVEPFGRRRWHWDAIKVKFLTVKWTTIVQHKHYDKLGINGELYALHSYLLKAAKHAILAIWRRRNHKKWNWKSFNYFHILVDGTYIYVITFRYYCIIYMYNISFFQFIRSYFLVDIYSQQIFCLCNSMSLSACIS